MFLFACPTTEEEIPHIADARDVDIESIFFGCHSPENLNNALVVLPEFRWKLRSTSLHNCTIHNLNSQAW